MAQHTDIERLSQQIGMPESRVIVAIAGPPASGKSTFAEALRDCINHNYPDSAEVFPMDGYHFDDTYLTPMGWQARKGAPHTFDVGGLHAMFARLKLNEEPEIAVPVFDRSLEIARAGARIIPQETKIIIAEGNYLLLKLKPWSNLCALFDLSVMLDVPVGTLEARLQDRWARFGFTKAEATEKISANDLLNIHEVLNNSSIADITFKTEG